MSKMWKQRKCANEVGNIRHWQMTRRKCKNTFQKPKHKCTKLTKGKMVYQATFMAGWEYAQRKNIIPNAVFIAAIGKVKDWEQSLCRSSFQNSLSAGDILRNTIDRLWLEDTILLHGNRGNAPLNNSYPANNCNICSTQTTLFLPT